MVSYSSSQTPQQLHPLSLFAQVTNQCLDGCLRVVSGANYWLIFLEQGRLTFAFNSINPLERFDRQLNQFSLQVPALVSAVRAQARARFERAFVPNALIPADYQALCWLKEQHYLNETQVTELVQEIAKEVLESLLRVTEGHYELTELDALLTYKPLCQIELRPLVEYCQAQLRQQPISKPSVFTFQEPATPVPKDVPHLNATQTEDEKHWYGTTPQALTSHYTIACIDDSPTVLQAIHSFLDDSNLSIVMINDPLKALIQIIRCKPNLILLDVGMPNLDGYELCSMLRRHPTFKHTPIVMVTGNTGFIDRAKAKLVGASGYLTKPFTRSDLMKMVFKHLT